MNLKSLFILMTAMALGVSVKAQERSSTNPFPEAGKQTDSEIFDLTKNLNLDGAIAQPVSQPSQAPEVLYFRIDANDPSNGSVRSWSIRIPPVRIACFDCLIDYYQPEMSRLTVGTIVSAIIHPAKDGSSRALLVPQSGPGVIGSIRTALK